MRPLMFRPRECRAALWAVLAFAVVPALASAQLDTGGITGVAADETGAALPGVTVTVTNLATRQARTVVTNERGAYLVPALQPGKYSVTAELPGFSTVIRPEITVSVGSALDINLVLRVAAVQETLTVSGEAPIVERTRTDLSSVVTQEHLESLPSKNRQYLDFTLLMPATTENVSRTQGTGAVIGGARSKEGTLLVDGFYNLDEGFTLPKQRHSQDLVQEFQVVSFGGSAEHGRAIGGLINVVTKSGGNQVHGSGYGFFRDTRLNAQDPGEKRRGTPKSEYDRQQWGGTLGGPIKRDKSFFFGAFERVSEDWPFDNGIRPEDGAAIGLPPADIGTVPRFYRATFAFGKWDHNLSPSNRLQVSYSLTRVVEQTFTVRPLYARSANYGLYPTDEVYLAKWTGIAGGGRALHEVKAAYFPRRYGARGQQNTGGPPLAPEGQLNPPLQGERIQLSPASPPLVNIASAAVFGSTQLNNRIYTYPVQALYTSSFFTERHTIKFGADYMYAYYDYNQYSPYRGSYSFGSLANFLIGRYNTYTQSFGDTFNPRTHQYVSGFLQDSWQVSNRLTMNYGLRYDLELNPKQVKGGVPYGNDYNNVGPRFALSYGLTDKGTTFLKLTTGVYYDRIWGNAHNNLYNLKDHELRVTATWRPMDTGAPVYPQVFAEKPATIPPSVIDVIIMPDKLNIPTTAQVVGTIEHALAPNLAFTASAIYTRSWYKDYTWDTNLEWDEARQRYFRPNPNYRRITQTRYQAPAEFVGGIVEIDRRGARVGFNANLTVSRAFEVREGTINDQRAGFRADWGPAADVPTVRGVLSAWCNLNPQMQLSGIFRARSGLPVNPVAAGLDLNGDSVFGDRTPTLAPYSFRSPSNNSADVRFTWMVPFPNGRKLNFYIESFNLLNTENVRAVLNDYGRDPANPGPRWLEPSSYFPPREVQLGGRFVF